MALTWQVAECDHGHAGRERDRQALGPAVALEGLPVGYFQYGNLEEGISFTDYAEGNLDDTAFTEISINPEENYVYIVSLGNEIPVEEELEARETSLPSAHSANGRTEEAESLRGAQLLVLVGVRERGSPRQAR